MEQLTLPNTPPPAPQPPPPRCTRCGSVLPSRAQRHAQVARQRARPARDWAAEWSALIKDQPQVANEVRRIALELAAGTTGQLSVDRVWTEYRAQLKVALDHNHRAAAARWLMQVEPALAGRYRVRETPGDPTRARRPR